MAGRAAVNTSIGEGDVEARRPAPPCVLVADDDPDIREALHLLLEEDGYSVTEARDGLTTLASLRETTDQCVLVLDLVMPHVDGMDVLRTIAADDALRVRVGIVVCTARSRGPTPDEEALLDFLNVILVQKPFTLDAMLGAVAEAWRRMP